ncbi:recombinase family protein [Actinospongicola halichondriae]|uniref:recombinase family protein n=1 Tax=Actinospongicola halichondriae TaxID=3236844 RepID=UPI003D4D3804
MRITKSPRAAIYCRISQEDADDPSQSPERQLEDCQERAERDGYTVVATYTDRDLSAYQNKVKRPEWQALLSEIEAGKVDVLIVWKSDRAMRSVLDFAALLKFLLDHDCQLVSCTEQIDTSTPMGKGFALMLATMAEQESANISVRVKRALKGRAERGQHRGKRTFGYTADMEVVPEEADVLRQMAERVSLGHSYRSIAKWLNDELGLSGARGAAWTAQAIKSTLRRPALAGWLEYNGTKTKGDWESILDQDTWAQLQDIVSVKRDKVSPHRGDYLLTGFARCGDCGRKMYAKTHAKNGLKYVCIGNQATNADERCSRSVVAKGLEGHVEKELVAHWASKNAESRSTAPESSADTERLKAEIDALQVKLDDMVRAYYGMDTDKDASLSDEMYAELSDGMRNKLNDLQNELLAATEPALAAGLASNITDPEKLAEVWEGLTVASQRQILAEYVERVDIAPSAKRGPIFDTGRVKISFH